MKSDNENATKTEIVLATSGLTVLMHPHNMGTISSAACGTGEGEESCPANNLTADDQHFLIYSPTNYADTSITFGHGRVTVIGGTNVGTMT